MLLEQEWVRGYALQARADMETFRMLLACDRRTVPKCHVLHFLQMACEKLVKAHLIRDSAMSPGQLRHHAVVRKHLPSILRQYYSRRKRRSMPRHLFDRYRQLAREIELLAPAVDDAGRLPANCEYPWENSSQTHVFIPVEYAFASIKLRGDAVFHQIIQTMRDVLDQLPA